MTREEAIAILNHNVSACLRGTEWGEALEMAIKALEQEPTTKNDLPHCQHTDEEIAKSFIEDVEAVKELLPTTKNNLGVDCISRQAVIDLMMQKWGENFSGDDAMQESIDAIRVMPSVTPQEPRWIPVSERLPDMDDEVLCWYEYYHWSQEKVLPEYGIGGYFKETSSWYGEVASGRDVRVIAWMPLPKAYGEVEE